MAKSTIDRVYQPGKTFDEALMELAGFYSDNSLKFDEIASPALEQAGISQRDERTEDSRRVAATAGSHQLFIRRQRARYALFAQALDFAEAHFKYVPEKLKELEPFRATRASNGTPEEDGAPQPK